MNTVVVVSGDRNPLRTLLVPLLAALLAIVWGHLPTAWVRVKFSRLVTSGILGSDATQLLGGVPENVIQCLKGWWLLCFMHATSGQLYPWPFGVIVVSPLVDVFTLALVPRVSFGLRAHVTLVSLSASLGSTRRPRCHSESWDEKLVSGSGAVLAEEGSAVGLCQSSLV
jgi:hypothetical protein